MPQGYELEIMRHGTATLANTLVIECETEFVPLYKDQPLFGDVQCFLRDQGFMLHKLIDVAGRPFRPFNPPNPYQPMSQLLWADAIFVRTSPGWRPTATTTCSRPPRSWMWSIRPTIWWDCC